ncbi:MAG: DUF58 domain-containing protein [Clostridiales bacterium]|nr:DUF58 domain-containing protein [Clostridiales bacterium]
MRKNRIIIFSLILLALFFGLYTGDRIYFIALSILISMVIVSAVMGLWILIDFRYLQTLEPSYVEKGNIVTLRMEIHNDRPFIYPYLKVFFRTPKEAIIGARKERVMSLLPFSHRAIEESFPCTLRGRYSIGIESVQVQDLFGLFTFNISLPEMPYYKHLYLTVHPRILDILNLPLHFIDVNEVQSDRLSQTQEISSISDIRQYEYGDSLKRIHWQISSKYQDLYVKEYETSSAPKVHIFLDTTHILDDALTRYEIEDQLIESSLSVIAHMLHKDLSTELIVYNSDRVSIRGQNPYHISRFFDTLSLIDFKGYLPLDKILSLEGANLEQGHNVAMFTYNLSYELFNRICTLKELGLFPMLFLIQYNENVERNIKNMVARLNDMNIPSYIIPIDRRIDRVLEELV